MSHVTSPDPVSASAPQSKRGTHHQRLVRLRDQERQRRQTVVALAAVVMAMLSAAALAALDFRYELSSGLRLLAWGVVAAIVAGAVVTVWQWIRYESSDAVSQAERIWPQLGQRLRTSHDYQENPEAVSPADPTLVQALESDTQDQVAHQPATPLGPGWPIAALLGVGALTVLVWLLALAISPEWRIATARLWFAPLHYSKVDMDPLPASIHLGDDLVVQLNVQGRPLKSARLRYRQPGEEAWNELDFQPLASGSLIDDIEAVIPGCQSDLEVEVEAGPLHTGTHPIAVRLPLVLEQWKATVKPPAYTKMPESQGTPGEVRIPQGSTLQLQAQYNRPPAGVTVESKPQSLSPAETNLSESVATVSLGSVGKSTDLRVRAETADQMRDESSLRLNVIPDREPKLKFVAPNENAEAIATAELRFTLETVDDYGVSSIGIRYRIDDGPEQTLWESEPDGADKTFAQTVVLPLEELGVSYPQAITYYAYALDNREPEPQRVTSELRFVDIRPFSRDYEFKDAQGNCQGECLSLEKLISEQRRILGETFSAVQRDASPNEIGPKLASQESELRSQTESLTTALEAKVGPMPSLQFAVRAMSDAQRDLQDKALPQGQVDEEHALAYLIAARTNLRKILKQGGAQAQMCRNVDREQMDKVRRPERNQEQKQQSQKKQQLAQIRKQLQELAKQQQSFCQSASACQQASQSNPSSSTAKSSEATKDASTPTRQQLASQQSEAAEATREMQSRLEQSDVGSLAPQRLQEATKSIEGSAESIAKEDGFDEAIAGARDAAEKLERLAEHLGQRNEPDFHEKLAVAERQSQQLSDEQERLIRSLRGQQQNREANDGQEGTASNDNESTTTTTNNNNEQSSDGSRAEQQRLTGRTEELADLIDQLVADSVGQDWDVQRELSEQVSMNPPHAATDAMKQVSQELNSGSLPQAIERAAAASSLLQRLAQGLREVHRASGEDRLRKLTDAEQRAAALLKSLARDGSAGEQAMARTQARQFAEDLQAWSRHDSELFTSSQYLAESYATSSERLASPEGGPEQEREGTFASPPTNLVEALRQVDVLLQRRIQEAIVSGAVQQAVGAVPPQYSDMVDEYYRVLSEDIE